MVCSYVREMLGALTSSGLVQLAEGTGGQEGQEAAYLVAPEHQRVLKKVACDALIISDVARQFSSVKPCVARDGPDSEFLLPPEISRQQQEQQLIIV